MGKLTAASALGALLGLTIGLATPAAARVMVPVRTLTVVNDTGVPAARVAQVERVLVVQARQLRARWGTPPIRFAPGGWQVRLVNDPAVMCGEAYGCHTSDAATPFAVVTIGDGWTVRFSHEVLEMLVDPYVDRVEVCDPAEVAYRLDGVAVSDFVFPDWAVRGSRGPWDEARLVRRSRGYAVREWSPERDVVSGTG